MADRDEKAREYAGIKLGEYLMDSDEAARIYRAFLAGHRSRDAEVRELVEGLRTALARLESYEDREEHNADLCALLDRYKEDA